jgi:hypothetical protein
VVPLKCPIGYYCLENTTLDFDYFQTSKCPDGYYTGPFSIKEVRECNLCPAGHTCMKSLNSVSGVVTGMISKIPEQINAMPTPCKPGYYKETTGSGYCVKCPAKKPCPYYGLTTYETGLYCAPGYYCPEGTRFPNEFPWPAGTFSDSIEIISSSQC